MPDKEKVIKSLKWFRDRDSWREGIMIHDDHADVRKQICDNALALLKEQENLKGKLLRNIADNQLAVSPTGYETEEELAKRTGEWNGLQMAYEIVLNDGN